MPSHQIGTMNEASLHAEIKQWYLEDGDCTEMKLGGYLIDIIRGELLIEIQTSYLYKIREKLKALLPKYRIRLVCPIAVHKWITRCDADLNLLSRRRSPKQGHVLSIFDQLVYLPSQVLNPNFSLELLLVEQEDIWIDDGRGSWRRNHWSIADRSLLAVCGKQVFNSPKDYLAVIPCDLTQEFSSQELAIHLEISRKLATKILYCLSGMKLIDMTKVINRRRYYTKI